MSEAKCKCCGSYPCTEELLAKRHTGVKRQTLWRTFLKNKDFKITTSYYVILFLWFGYSGHCFDCDINPSWNAVWWAKLGAIGFSGLPPWVVELLVGWEALRVNRSWHENTDLVRCSEGRGRGYACCIYKEGQRPQKKESLGVLVSKQGQEKISAVIQRHHDVAVRTACFFLS